MRPFLEEGRQALRSLLRQPAYAATCVALLAIGIASTTAILAVGDALLSRPLPVREGDRLVVPYGSLGDDKRLDASTIDAEAWGEAAAFEGFAVAHPGAVTLEVDGEPDRISAARIEADYFQVLGVVPLVGRAFDASEARADARLVVLGHGLWQRRFGSDVGVIGEVLRIDGDAYAWEVIGVMPPGFDLPVEAEMWRPLDIAATPAQRRPYNVLQPVARLAPGSTLNDARVELASIARGLEQEHPETNLGWGVRAISLRRHVTGDPGGMVERAVVMTLCGAVFLLLIACANVVQLQMLRASERGTELGTRLALGGSQASLARMLAFEAMTLTAAAALLSAPLSFALAEGLVRLRPVSTTAFSSSLSSASYDSRVILGAALIVIVAGLVAGAYPALRAGRTDVSVLLAGGTRTSLGRRGRGFLEFAVLAQVAVTVTLLAATATLGESYALLRGLDLGYRAPGLTYYELPLSPIDYEDHERRVAFTDALVETVREIDGVESVAVTTNAPLMALNWIASYGCEGRELAPGELLLTADRLVGPGYIETLGLPLVAGRTLTDRDLATSEPVAVINESLAEECWQGQEAVGKRVLRLKRAGPLPMTVVGVVADAREIRVGFRNAHAAWYLPYRQHQIFRDLNLVVRGDPSPAELRARVRSLDPHQPVSAPHRLTDSIDEITGSDRMAAVVMGYFAVLGLILVGAGVHGSMHRFVAQRRRAIGTRMALGARPSRIARMVVGRALALSAVGAALGVLGAAALQRLSASFVFGALVDGPTRLAVTAGVVLLLAVAACAAPAYRASRGDPASLLRE